MIFLPDGMYGILVSLSRNCKSTWAAEDVNGDVLLTMAKLGTTYKVYCSGTKDGISKPGQKEDKCDFLKIG